MANAKRQRQDEARKRKLEDMAKVKQAEVRKRKLTRWVWIGGAVVLLIGLLLWKGRDRGSSAAADTTVAPVETTTTVAAIQLTAAQQAALKDKPTPKVPPGPVKALATEDLVEGTGVGAKPGDQLKVRYVGVSQTNKGAEFDSSWNVSADNTFGLTLGAGQVIPGWDQGLVGMKVGGRRQITIPAELAYGANPPSDKIAKNDTLVFVVDLMSLVPGVVPDAPAATVAAVPSAGETTVTAPPTSVSATSAATTSTASTAAATTTTP